MVINQRYITGYKPKNYLVVTMDTDEDEDTMNSDDATAKKNIELDHNYALQPSQFPHPQPPPTITNLQIFHTPELLHINETDLKKVR